MLWSLLFWITLGATLAQLGYWLVLFSRLAYHRPEPVQDLPEALEPPVSVIICARNEAENLRRNLGHFLNQKYRSFEIIVVNDHSSDETLQVLLEFQKNNPILRIISIKELTPPGKKAALTRGIEAAQFDILFLSDADCRPSGPMWIRQMQKALRSPRDLVLGYSPYLRQPGLLNVFIRFETIYTAIQYFSLALMGLPYMGVGRNLAYRKQLFQNSGGFRSHEHIASGDDDLFVNRAANGNNTAVAIHQETWVYSVPQSTWKGYYNQKSRHLTTGRRYRAVHQILLGGLAASHMVHYLGISALLVSGTWSFEACSLFMVRMGVVAWMYARILQRFKEPSLIKWIPLLDAAFTCYYLLFSPVLLISGNQKQWK